MESINEFTGAKMKSKELSEQGKKNWDTLFGPKEKTCAGCKKECECESSLASQKTAELSQKKGEKEC